MPFSGDAESGSVCEVLPDRQILREAVVDRSAEGDEPRRKACRRHRSTSPQVLIAASAEDGFIAGNDRNRTLRGIKRRDRRTPPAPQGSLLGRVGEEPGQRADDEPADDQGRAGDDGDALRDFDDGIHEDYLSPVGPRGFEPAQISIASAPEVSDLAGTDPP